MSIGVAQLVIIRKALGENGRLVTKIDRSCRPLELPAAERAQLFVTFSGDEALWSRIEAALAPVLAEISPAGPIVIDQATAMKPDITDWPAEANDIRVLGGAPAE